MKHIEKIRHFRNVRVIQLLFAIAVIMTGLFVVTVPGISFDQIMHAFLTEGISYASIMGVIGSVDRVPNKDRTGNKLKYKLFIISEDQFDDTVGFPTKSNGAYGTIPLKSGQYWQYIEAVDGTPNAQISVNEGDISSTINNQISFTVGGMNDKVREIVDNGLNEYFYVVFEECESGDRYLIGNGCKPARLSNVEGGHTNDNTSATLTFTNECGEVYAKYTGSITLQAPETVPADATTITLTNNSAYQLQDGSSAIATITGFTSVTESDVGRVVTIYGSGGDYPSEIVSGNDFILNDGETWTATAGAQISFKIYKSGTDAYTFIEVVGSRVN